MIDRIPIIVSYPDGTEQRFESQYAVAKWFNMSPGAVSMALSFLERGITLRREKEEDKE